ncbi:MAG: hypothetical protein IPK74_39415 [Deltaproteobacteria bacterium]|nr:hypothetical protein [Deltaproteobacteria bacterium]
MKHPIAHVLLAFVFACAADDDDDATATIGTTGSTHASASTSPGDDGTATMTGAEATTDTTATTSGGADGSSGDATDGSSGGDDSSGGAGATAQGSDSGGTDLCAPLPTDDACVACAKQQCCDVYAACYGDPDCACAVDCILETGDYATCLGTQCNMPDPTPAMDIGLCYGTTCADACGL